MFAARVSAIAAPRRRPRRSSVARPRASSRARALRADRRSRRTRQPSRPSSSAHARPEPADGDETRPRVRVSHARAHGRGARGGVVRTTSLPAGSWGAGATSASSGRKGTPPSTTTRRRISPRISAAVGCVQARHLGFEPGNPGLARRDHHRVHARGGVRLRERRRRAG